MTVEWWMFMIQYFCWRHRGSSNGGGKKKYRAKKKERKLGMLSPELLIKIIQRPMTRISVSVRDCVCIFAHPQIHARTHICSHICTRLFYLAYSTVIALKWVKTKWKSRNFPLRERDRQGERQIHRGRRRDRLGWGREREESCLIRKVSFIT